VEELPDDLGEHPSQKPYLGAYPMKSLNCLMKRCMDVALSVILLVATAPLLLLIAIVVRWTSEGPALFRQMRVGKDGRNFTILKFRTMVQNAPDLRNADNSTFNSDHDPRLTKIGRLLRKTSCDELPQLVNVLCGEMSLVGPRPELPEGPASYTQSQFARLKVRPGITGLAAVHGRNDVPVNVRRDLDAQYAESWTFLLDLKIMVQTIAIIFQRRGVNRRANDNAGHSSEGSVR
jgi:lipopolysaccharide/colanic/teichoic acid biosynthesis glycosyltransferase